MPTIMDDISEPRGEHLGEIRAQQRPKHAREPHRVSARKARTSSGDQPGKQNNVVPGVGVVRGLARKSLHHAAHPAADPASPLLKYDSAWSVCVACFLAGYEWHVLLGFDACFHFCVFADPCCFVFLLTAALQGGAERLANHQSTRLSSKRCGDGTFWWI